MGLPSLLPVIEPSPGLRVKAIGQVAGDGPAAKPSDEFVAAHRSAYKHKVGNRMDWYSSSQSTFGADMDAPPGGGFAVNVFLRDGDTVYRTWHTNGRGTEQLSHSFGLIDILPWGRQEEWQDSPHGWPSRPTFGLARLPRHRPRLRTQRRLMTAPVGAGRMFVRR